MDGIKNLFLSEHGVLAILIIVGATVLAALGIMTIPDWKGLVQVVFGAFGVTHVGVALAGSLKREPVPETRAATKEKK